MDDAFKRPDCACFKNQIEDTKIIAGDYKSNAIAHEIYGAFRELINIHTVCPQAISFISVETIAFLLRACAFHDLGYEGDDSPDLAKLKARFDELVEALPKALLECDERISAVLESQQAKHQ